MTLATEIRRLLSIGGNDLHDALSDLKPEEWRQFVCEAGAQRCLACGSDCDCECSDEVDAAKDLVVGVAVALSRPHA